MHIQNKDTTAATSQIYLLHPVTKNPTFLTADNVLWCTKNPVRI